MAHRWAISGASIVPARRQRGMGDPANLGVVAPIGVTGREPELRVESPICDRSTTELVSVWLPSTPTGHRSG
ncbi:hypothetical protein U1Q18_041540 [Sarracenia purpurea var. burkii]